MTGHLVTWSPFSYSPCLPLLHGSLSSCCKPTFTLLCSMVAPLLPRGHIPTAASPTCRRAHRHISAAAWPCSRDAVGTPSPGGITRVPLALEKVHTLHEIWYTSCTRFGTTIAQSAEMQYLCTVNETHWLCGIYHILTVKYL